MEDDLNFFFKGRWPKKFVDGWEPQIVFNGKQIWLTNLIWPELGTAQPQLVQSFCFKRLKLACIFWRLSRGRSVEGWLGWWTGSLGTRSYGWGDLLGLLGKVAVYRKIIMSMIETSLRLNNWRCGWWTGALTWWGWSWVTKSLLAWGAQCPSCYPWRRRLSPAWLWCLCPWKFRWSNWVETQLLFHHQPICLFQTFSLKYVRFVFHICI